MPLLTQEEIEARIKLYADLRAAMDELTLACKMLPVEFPASFRVEWDDGTSGAFGRVEFVIRRAWTALRAAALKDAEKKVERAEAAVKAFESGEEVPVEQEQDG